MTLAQFVAAQCASPAGGLAPTSCSGGSLDAASFDAICRRDDQAADHRCLAAPDRPAQRRAAQPARYPQRGEWVDPRAAFAFRTADPRGGRSPAQDVVGNIARLIALDVAGDSLRRELWTATEHTTLAAGREPRQQAGPVYDELVITAEGARIGRVRNGRGAYYGRRWSNWCWSGTSLVHSPQRRFQAAFPFAAAAGAWSDGPAAASFSQEPYVGRPAARHMLQLLHHSACRAGHIWR